MTDKSLTKLQTSQGRYLFTPQTQEIFLYDSQGRSLTRSLFVENYPHSQNHPPIYTLMERDKGEMLSARRIYLECEDPTEYLSAMALVASWATWQKLRETAWFEPYLESWREELAVKLQSQGHQELVRIANDPDSRSQASAAKYLADKGWRDKKEKGRPSKAQVAGEAKKIAMADKSMADDAERIGLNK